MVIVGSFGLEGNDDEGAARKTGKEAKSARLFVTAISGQALRGLRHRINALQRRCGMSCNALR
jgi:hypothetical protein